MTIYRALVWVEVIRPLSRSEKYENLGRNHHPTDDIPATFMGVEVYAVAGSTPDRLSTRVQTTAEAIPHLFKKTPHHIHHQK